jgi:hypothetical protein
MALEQHNGLELAQFKERLRNCQAELEAQQDRSDRAQRIQSALYRIAEAASAVKDMQEFYNSVHRIVGELMYAENCYIATYDERTNLVSYPYWVDKLVMSDYHRSRLVLEIGRQWVIQHGEVLDDASGKTAELIKTGEFVPEGTNRKESPPRSMRRQNIGDDPGAKL